MRHVTSSVPLGLEQTWQLFDIQNYRWKWKIHSFSWTVKDL